MQISTKNLFKCALPNYEKKNYIKLGYLHLRCRIRWKSKYLVQIRSAVVSLYLSKILFMNKWTALDFSAHPPSLLSWSIDSWSNLLPFLMALVRKNLVAKPCQRKKSVVNSDSSRWVWQVCQTFLHCNRFSTSNVDRTLTNQ